MQVKWSDSPVLKEHVHLLSPECHDLLDKIFVTDPKRRITVSRIIEHPFYTEFLTDSNKVRLPASCCCCTGDGIVAAWMMPCRWLMRCAYSLCRRLHGRGCRQSKWNSTPGGGRRQLTLPRCGAACDVCCGSTVPLRDQGLMPLG